MKNVRKFLSTIHLQLCHSHHCQQHRILYCCKSFLLLFCCSVDFTFRIIPSAQNNLRYFFLFLFSSTYTYVYIYVFVFFFYFFLRRKCHLVKFIAVIYFYIVLVLFFCTYILTLLFVDYFSYCYL